MREAFRRLREKWRLLGHVAAGQLFLRIGLSFGKVARAEIGYRNSRMTVIGKPVNTAAKACGAAPRDRDVIVVTPAFNAAVMGSIDIAKLTSTTPDLHDDLFELL
jgi:class 3 adenylate cyclase